MPNIVSQLILRADGFGAGVKAAQNSLKSLNSSVSSAKTLITGAFGLITTSALALGLKNAFDVGAELYNLSNATGTGVKSLVTLQQAFSACGVDADKVTPALGRMRKAIVAASQGGGAQGTFAKLGVNLKQLGTEDAAQQMQTVGAAIARMKNPTEQSAAAMALFGRNGQQMVAMFHGGTFGEAAEAVAQKAAIMDKNSAIFHDITEKLKIVGIRLQGFFFGLASTLAPALKPVLDSLSKINFAGLGEQIGNVVAFIVDAFSSGEIGSIVGNSLMISFGAAVNFILGGLVGCAFAFGQYIIEEFKSAITLLEIITTANFWKGLGDALLGCAQGMISFLLSGVAMLLRKLDSIPKLGKYFDKAADSVEKAADKLNQKGKTNRDRGADLLGPAAAQATQRGMDALHNIGAAFTKGQAVGSVVDTSGNQAALDKSVGKVMGVMAAQQKAADKFNKENKPGQQGAAPPLAARIPKLGPAFEQSLTKVGGGGLAVGMFGSKNPVLDETRKHTSLLQQIARNTGLKTGGLTTGGLATFAL